jgi:cellulose synthase/poly-beta-1,6-N-acetylglucosamine synthase-like glycosyltransferase
MQKVITYGVLHFNPTMYAPATEKFIEAVDSLFQNKNPALNSEVYLIDQGNSPEEREVVAGLAKKYNCHFLSLKENVGISRGINLLFNIARGEYICLVTSDVVVPPNLDNILIEELVADPSILQICPLSDLSSIEYQKGSLTEDKPLKCIAQELTIQMWPRRTIETIGFFNETFKAAYENLDYATRLFISGHYAAISRKIKCKHYHNMTSKSGAIEKAYDNYITMPNGFDHTTLRRLWNMRWRNINWDDVYRPEFLTESYRKYLFNLYESNIYMNYIQEVDY